MPSARNDRTPDENVRYDTAFALAESAWHELDANARLGVWRFRDGLGRERRHVLLALTVGGALVGAVHVARGAA